MSSSVSTSTSSPTAAALFEEWTGVRAVDHHCHPLRRWPATVSAPDLRAAFTEALDTVMVEEHVINSAGYRAALQRIAAELGCDPDEQTILEHRKALEPHAHARHLMNRSGTGLMLVDTGFASPDAFTLSEQEKAFDIPQREVVRLETLAESLLRDAKDAGEWLARIDNGLRQARDRGAVGVKTICAYRASLRLRGPDPTDVDAGFDTLKEIANQQPVRLEGNTLCHAVLFEAARVCVDLDLPLQVHCGFGDPDENLAEASPLGLRPLFIDPMYRGLKVVLLHCYPYHREAAYLCSVFPGVYMDLSLAIPLAAVDGAHALKEALGLCPTSKLLYASDASRYPEVFFVAATLHREALADAFAELIDHRVFTVAEAVAAGEEILRNNALRLYNI